MKNIEFQRSLKIINTNPTALAVVEYVTPYKICVALFLHEFIYLKNPKFRRENVTQGNCSCSRHSGIEPIEDISEAEEKFINSIQMEPSQRKHFCRLLLKLIQSNDLDLCDLVKKIVSDTEIHPGLKACWKRKLASICHDPVSGLMTVMSEFERLLCESHALPFLHKLSVSGLFIRRILLGFDKLSFTEVSNFSAIFQTYYFDGLDTILELGHDEEIMDQSINLSNFLYEVSSLTRQLVDQRTNDSKWKPLDSKNSKWTQKQSDLYVSKQVTLLQYSENNADDPAKIEKTVQKISQDNPDLPQVHYLSYLNSLRTKDFCNAVKSLYWSFDRNCKCESFHQPEMDAEKINDEADRGFRYAALSCAALHANFDHKDEAIASLKGNIKFPVKPQYCRSVLIHCRASWICSKFLSKPR